MSSASSPPSSRLLKKWGDEAVVYDTASGDTHYLKPITFALYETCCAHPGAHPRELAEALARRLGLPDTEELLELTQDTLRHLRDINLLEAE